MATPTSPSVFHAPSNFNNTPSINAGPRWWCCQRLNAQHNTPLAMPAVRILDLQPERGGLAVDLRHVISVLGERALSSVWRVRDVWATGEATEELENLDEGTAISGHRLLGLSQRVIQIIDGVFSAFDSDSASPWVVVEARDSSFYAVHSSEDSVLAAVSRAYHSVVPHEYPVTAPR
jgi:hypothetical protein